MDPKEFAISIPAFAVVRDVRRMVGRDAALAVWELAEHRAIDAGRDCIGVDDVIAAIQDFMAEIARKETVQ